MKPFQFKIVKRSMKVDLPSFPQQSAQDDPEQLTGMVQGKQASAPEERMSKALDESKIQYIFRYVVGAPKGLPGWKELDFLVYSGGEIRAVEVDTAFTHRNKQQSDVLHDAIVLNDRAINSMGELYPTVMHVDGDSDLADKDKARKFVQRNFTRGVQTMGRTNDYEVPEPSPSLPSPAPSPTPANVVPQITRKDIGNADRKEQKARQAAQQAKRAPAKAAPKNASQAKKISKLDK